MSAAAAANRRGILSMVGAMACFVANDTVVKLAGATMPTTQLVFLRGVIATAIVLVVVHAVGASSRIREVAQTRVLVRALAEAFATLLYLVALVHLPLANAAAINLSAPMFIVVLAAVFMGEKPGGAQALAIAAGFAGVLLVVQPGLAGFDAYALVCLLSALLQAARDLLTRRIASDVPSVLITLSTTLAVTVLAGALSLVEGWKAFDAGQLALLALAAAFLMGAYYLIVDAMRHGEIALVAPFRYVSVLYAIVVGYLVWGDVPDAPAWAGIALLVSAGLYVIGRERMRARRGEPRVSRASRTA